MKKFIKSLSAVLLCGLLSLSAFQANTLAAVPPGPGSVDFYGPSVAPWLIEGAIYTVWDNRQITDFFGEATKGLKPGDVRSFTVRLTNNYSRAVEFFMRTAPVTHDPNDSLDGAISEDLTTPGADFDDKTTLGGDYLLDAVHIKITHPFAPTNPPLYSGWLRGDKSGLYGPGWTSLGWVAAGRTGLIEVTIIVPIELPNFFQNSLAAVEWQFYAQFDDTITPPPSPSPSPPPSEPPSASPPPSTVPSPPPSPGEDESPPPDETISPTVPPLVPESEPPDETIPPSGPPRDDPDYDVVVDPPKTGDDQNVLLWAAACVLAMAALAMIFITTIRKKREEKKK
ncbi:MAG: hypothetical protein FWE59_04400 [Oscillospiraceae bacterium]|nr:hypothetical protein [Oscillospiraceae bacterium]